MSKPDLIRSIEIRTPLGAPGLEISCLIYGKCVADEDGKHCLSVFYDGDLIRSNNLGAEVIEEGERLDLCMNGYINPFKMQSTGSNYT